MKQPKKNATSSMPAADVTAATAFGAWSPMAFAPQPTSPMYSRVSPKPILSSRLRDASRSVSLVNVQTGTFPSFDPFQEEVLETGSPGPQLKQVDTVRHQEARHLGRHLRARDAQHQPLAFMLTDVPAFGQGCKQ